MYDVKRRRRKSCDVQNYFHPSEFAFIIGVWAVKRGFKAHMELQQANIWRHSG